MIILTKIRNMNNQEEKNLEARSFLLWKNIHQYS